LAGFTRRLIESGAAYGIYHGANTGACTWYGFAREIFKIAGIGVELIPVPAAAFPRRAKIPKFAQLLNTKMPPQRGWQEGLKEYLKL
jgi:dTDP-4-dehydrorhamnose reductase